MTIREAVELVLISSQLEVENNGGILFWDGKICFNKRPCKKNDNLIRKKMKTK